MMSLGSKRPPECRIANESQIHAMENQCRPKSGGENATVKGLGAPPQRSGQAVEGSRPERLGMMDPHMVQKSLQAHWVEMEPGNRALTASPRRDLVEVFVGELLLTYALKLCGGNLTLAHQPLVPQYAPLPGETQFLS